MRSGENESANPFGGMQAVVRANGHPTPEQVATAAEMARLTVASNALDAEDCKDLLDALGLLPSQADEAAGTETEQHR